MLKKMLNKLRGERGDSVLVVTVISIPLFMLAFMFSVGLMQMNWQHVTQQDAAQAAAHKAASALEPNGYLGTNSINTMYSEYMKLSGRNAFTAAQIAAGARATNEAKGSQCTTVTVDGVEYPAPYMEIRLDRTRGTGTSDVDSPTFISIGGSTPASQYTLNERVNYRVISATIYEATESLLGSGLAIVGAADSNCTTQRIYVSGITFGANEDLSTIGQDASCWTPGTPTTVEPALILATTGSVPLYDGADYTCDKPRSLNSPYVKVTQEYGAFYRVEVDGTEYWVAARDLRPAAACTERSLTAGGYMETRSASNYLTDGVIPVYSSPFEDCQLSGAGSTVGAGTVSLTDYYNGPFGQFLKLASQPGWVKASDVKRFYTLSFSNPNGPAIPSQAVPEGTEVTLPTATRTGYDFVGWKASASGSTLVPTPYIMPSSNTTLYADYGVATYRILIDPNGGVVNNCNYTSYNINSPTLTVTCASTSKPGHQFAGFTPGTVPAGSTGDKTLTANWTPINYSIAYNLDGGSVATSCTPTSYTINSATFTPNCTPTRSGYSFSGWTPANVPSGSTGNKTFTANWTAVTRTVVVDKRGGGATATLTFNEGTSITQSDLGSVSRSGWSLRGFRAVSPTASCVSGQVPNVTFPYTVTDNVKLCAQWQRTVNTSTWVGAWASNDCGTSFLYDLCGGTGAYPGSGWSCSSTPWVGINGVGAIWSGWGGSWYSGNITGYLGGYYWGSRSPGAGGASCSTSYINYD